MYFISCFITYRAQLFKVELDTSPIKTFGFVFELHFCKRAVDFCFERGFYFHRPLWNMKFCFLTKNICLLWLSLFFLPSIVSDLPSYISHHLFKESREIDDIYEYVCAELLDVFADELRFYCLATKACPPSCDPIDCSTPVFALPHHIPEFA